MATYTLYPNCGRICEVAFGDGNSWLKDILARLRDSDLFESCPLRQGRVMYKICTVYTVYLFSCFVYVTIVTVASLLTVV